MVELKGLCTLPNENNISYFKTTMNIEIKSDILRRSILIESSLAQLLGTILNIQNTDSKSLGYTGTALSFKAKTDLLYDIDRISQPLYNDLLTFMEIRNQFIHNSDTNSYELVIKRIPRKKNLLDFIKENAIFASENETSLKLGVQGLSISILENLKSAHLKILDELMTEYDKEDVEKNMRKIQLEILSECITSVFNRLKNTYEIVFDDKKDFNNILKDEILKEFSNRTEKKYKNS